MNYRVSLLRPLYFLRNFGNSQQIISHISKEYKYYRLESTNFSVASKKHQCVDK